MRTGHLPDHEKQIERVWYCPECDGLHVRNVGEGFVFKNDIGYFIMVYEMPISAQFKTHNLYYVGEL